MRDPNRYRLVTLILLLQSLNHEDLRIKAGYLKKDGVNKIYANVK